MAQEHTPTPWRYQGWDDTPGDRGAFILGGGPENSADEYMVGAALPLPITNRAECEANARFIVRAVNSHEALVIACRNALQSRTALLGECGHEPFVDSCTTCGLRSALALAEKDS